MTKLELIEDYIFNVYLFTSNPDGWCVKNKVTGRNIILQKLIKEIEQIFPNMESTKVVTNWWATNLTTTNQRVMWFMSPYRLILGNKIAKGWDIVDGGGKEFDLDKLIEHMPSHQNKNQIERLYREWFDDKLLEANVKLMGR